MIATQVPKCRSKAFGVVANHSILRPSSHITATPVGARHFSTAPRTLGSSQAKPSTTNTSCSNPKEGQTKQQGPVSNHGENDEYKPAAAAAPKKTVAELDAEMMKKMSGISGDGGSAGIEYEDGQPVSMKRSVKNNMFRYI